MKIDFKNLPLSITHKLRNFIPQGINNNSNNKATQETVTQSKVKISKNPLGAAKALPTKKANKF